VRSIQDEFPVIGDVRGLGLMIAVEFVGSNRSPNTDAVTKVVASCLDQGVLLITCGTYDQAIRVIPPLVINRDEAAVFLEIFRRAVASI
jgi:4-aminobutyrate aminotransferase